MARRRKKKSSTFDIILIIILFAICYYNKYGFSLSSAYETDSVAESTTYITPVEGTIEVYYLDVGEAESILIRESEREEETDDKIFVGCTQETVSWTESELSDSDFSINGIYAFELWCWRRLLRIP